MTFELFLSAIPFYYIVCFVSCYFLPIEQMFLFFFFYILYFFVHGAGPRL